jgi:AmmeMemoRadiSam system protein A
MAIPCAVLMCHAPIVIPEIGGARAGRCEQTTAAMIEVAHRVVAHAADVLVIISPHAPRDRTRFGVVRGDTLAGDFGRFGSPQVELRLPGAPAAARTLLETVAAHGIEMCELRGESLDHGALVPLHFLARAGWAGPTLLIALPYPGTGLEPAMGEALAEAAQRSGQRWSVLASGDMSHRLTLDAPAGYHPEAAVFDRAFRALIERGELARACAIGPGVRDIAAEDVVDSCAVAAAAVGFDATGHRVVSYEGPFGVGYLEAILHEEPLHASAGCDAPASAAAATAAPATEALAIARMAIEAHLRGVEYAPNVLPEPWERPRGVFVTLRRGGALRGCIGHLQPLHAGLSLEIADCAVGAATHDPRFDPLELHELDGLELEISLLSPPEPIVHIDQLDPERYGIVVSAGTRRGVLLPGVRGIANRHDQLRFALKKAGLIGDEEIRIERFQILKLCSENHARHDLH